MGEKLRELVDSAGSLGRVVELDAPSDIPPDAAATAALSGTASMALSAQPVAKLVSCLVSSFTSRCCRAIMAYGAVYWVGADPR
jgi:hypothetical protein